MTVKNGIVRTYPNRAVKEFDILNQIAGANCSRALLRKWIHEYWGATYPTLTWTGSSPLAYVDSFVDRVFVDPSIKFNFTAIGKIGHNLISIWTVDQRNIRVLPVLEYNSVPTYYTDVCLNITNLQIICTFFYQPSDLTVTITKLKYKFYFPQNPPSKRHFTYVINTQALNYNIK